jgi:NADH-quinone oxidoreductase subunit G
MAKVTIDDITIEVPDGTTILQAARMIGGDVVPPAMCYYSKIKNQWWLLPLMHSESRAKF